MINPVLISRSRALRVGQRRCLAGVYHCSSTAIGVPWQQNAPKKQGLRGQLSIGLLLRRAKAGTHDSPTLLHGSSSNPIPCTNASLGHRETDAKGVFSAFNRSINPKTVKARPNLSRLLSTPFFAAACPPPNGSTSHQKST
jgi:hypothetical protein